MRAVYPVACLQFGARLLYDQPDHQGLSGETADQMSRARTTSAATAGHLCFETYYDTKEGYTLKKMTTEEYVRDARFAPKLPLDLTTGRAGKAGCQRPGYRIIFWSVLIGIALLFLLIMLLLTTWH
jgi:hypothetical protein